MRPEDHATRVVTSTCLIKAEDLNHHHTFYAGRCVERCVQLAYIAAESCFDEARPLVFMSIRSLSMRSPARLGDILQFAGRVDYIGQAVIGVTVEAKKLQPKDDQQIVAAGAFLFCTVDEKGEAVPHGLPPLAPESTAAASRWRRAVESAEADLT